MMQMKMNAEEDHNYFYESYDDYSPGEQQYDFMMNMIIVPTPPLCLLTLEGKLPCLTMNQ
jgi:hypothetical protein